MLDLDLDLYGSKAHLYVYFLRLLKLSNTSLHTISPKDISLPKHFSSFKCLIVWKTLGTVYQSKLKDDFGEF